MTVEQHLFCAAFHGAQAESWVDPSQGNQRLGHDRAVLHATAAAHHALAAQQCRERVTRRAEEQR